MISDASDESEFESISSETTADNEPLSKSDTVSIVTTPTVDNDTSSCFLGCSSYCKDDRAPSFSRIKGKLIMCDANLVCGPNTHYHYFCEGFRRKPNNLKTKYACKKCREVHPDKENLVLENGFY